MYVYAKYMSCQLKSVTRILQKKTEIGYQESKNLPWNRMMDATRNTKLKTETHVHTSR